ncbi:MAG: hypothetical protein UT63_C0003G0005 [Candidatus Gottesmanbacteria bacterium GW2011_GWC2_39_8]|uniref:Tetratricopeptide repeat protein n=1 Tax=Candidatus Gottesmanbacteria bacterium GW2011_GWC2_39_8 TaxID=1618450 RepID=A0A0G0Q1P4_9BACT|nr:MAG: hypothetical protein UT63_C0003G0005 [Candidatus Gottesmanbacteria bacterium GW2011_GWC2_39_8]
MRKYIIIFLCLLLLLQNFFGITKYVKTTLNFLKKFPNLTNEQKLRESWGFYYDYLKFVKTNTNEKNIIGIPPQTGQWVESGSQVLNAYFLYPRKQLFAIPENIHKADYFMIYYGTDTALDKKYLGWPKFPVPVSEVKHPPEEIKFSLRNMTGKSNLNTLNPDVSGASRKIVSHKISEIDGTKTESIDAIFESSSYDFWFTDVSDEMKYNFRPSAEIKSNNKNAVSLAVEVDFGIIKAIFTSNPNKQFNKWETLNIPTLSADIKDFLATKKINPEYTRVSRIGLNINPFLNSLSDYGYGLGKIDKNTDTETNLSVVDSFYLYRRGTAYANTGDKEKAVNDYIASYFLSHNDYYLYLAVENLLDNKKFTDAEKLLSFSGTDDGYKAYLLGRIYFYNGYKEKAKDYFRKAISLDRFSFWSMQYLGKIFLEENLSAHAYYYLSKIDGFKPEDEISSSKEIYDLKVWAEKNYKTSWDSLILGDSYFILEDKIRAKKYYQDTSNIGNKDIFSELFKDL